MTVLLLGSSIGIAAAEERQKTVSVEEMTITARKMEEDLQKTPISVSAFSGGGLEDLLGSLLGGSQNHRNHNNHMPFAWDLKKSTDSGSSLESNT